MIEQKDRVELLDAVQQLHDHIAKMQTKDPIRIPYDNCLNCAHFNMKKEVCIKFKRRPPARVIAEGCPSWDIDLPF